MHPAIHNALIALQDGWLGRLGERVTWLFSVCETFHFIGLSLLLGALLVMDLRMLGFIRNVPYGAVLKLTPVAATGLAINVVSGAILFSSDPLAYWGNPAFRLKMLAVLLAAANAAWFVLLERQRLHTVGEERPPLAVQAPAAISLAAWLVVILLGRLLPDFAPVLG